MSDPEIDALVPRLDGSLRLSCWRTPSSWPNRDRINHLIADRIDSAPDVAAQIAELVSNRSIPGAPHQSSAEMHCAKAR